jgi:adenosylmethionine---8-amino-7-oxononanoate aminotransferase
MNNQEKDLKYNWHPYAQMKEMAAYPPPVITHAKGIKLMDENGGFYYDTIASWWCNVHGHNHPAITEAIATQAATLSHIMFGGLTHLPAITLSERLVELTPKGLDRVFYSDSGSTSVEIAMKMAFQFWLQSGYSEKQQIMCLENGYHGDTIGAMAVSGIDAFHGCFSPWLMPSIRVPMPKNADSSPQNQKIEEDAALSNLRRVLEKSHSTVAALIIEPRIQCAGGMRIHSAHFLRQLRALTSQFNVLLIADEIATGFGRTGPLFACESADINPDFMCISKGLTSGTLPLAATLTTSAIYEAFYADYQAHKTFYHGHTYTANPIACAAALASINLFETEGTLDKIATLSTQLEGHINVLAQHPNLHNPRVLGCIGAVDIVKDKLGTDPFTDSERIPFKLYQTGLRHHVMLRPMGNTLYFFLPACTTHAELDDIISLTQLSLEDVFK